MTAQETGGQETVWRRRECVSAPVEDALVLLDLDRLLYHSLNVTAAAVWERLERPRTVPELCAELCARFRVEPAPCRASVERLLGELERKNLVAGEPAAGEPTSREPAPAAQG